MRRLRTGFCSRIAAGLIVLVTVLPLGAQTRQNSLLHLPAPQFERTDLQGKRIDLKSYRGQVVLLTFWATWCAPCQIEMPHFIDWQSRYGKDGLQILAISMDDDAGPVKTLAARRKLNYPVIMGDPALGKSYGGVLGLPVTFLIDRKGRIAERFKGESDLKKMEKDLQGLLGSK